MYMRSWARANDAKIVRSRDAQCNFEESPEGNVLAWQKSKARSRVWIVQNNLHIAET